MAARTAHDPLMKPAIDRAIDQEMPLFAPRPFEPTTKQLAHVAAERVKHDRYHRILQCLADHGALAPFQVAEKLKVPQHTISGRFSELVNQKLIEKTGTRIRNPAGNTCNVYRLREHRSEV